jgi:hypothetical protein
MHLKLKAYSSIQEQNNILYDNGNSNNPIAFALGA